MHLIGQNDAFEDLRKVDHVGPNGSFLVLLQHQKQFENSGIYENIGVKVQADSLILYPIYLFGVLLGEMDATGMVEFTG